MRLGFVVALVCGVSTLAAATRAVGPGKQFSAPCAAIAVAQPGDLIAIDASGNYDGDVCGWTTNSLTLRGVGGKARIDAAGRNAAGKGIWVIGGNDTIVENIEFSGASVPDRNGAGIRIEGRNLTIRNCYFHDNEDGILGGAAGNVLIEYSEFADNGFGDGQSHNIYIGYVDSLTLRYSYSHHARIGHLVKSRAAVNYILYNRLSGEATGTESYELDLPNGGLSYVIGNVIEQGPATDNPNMLAYAEEGGSLPSQQLYVINNTFVNDGPSNGAFVLVPTSLDTPAVIRNTIFSGGGTITTQASAILKNNLSGFDPKFVDPAAYDYHLSPASPAINRGADPGQANGFPLAPAFEYVHAGCAEDRTALDAIDIGAYEFGNRPSSTICGFSAVFGGNTPFSVYSTGYSAPGLLLPDGAVDAHYGLTSSADPAFPGPIAAGVGSRFLARSWAPNGSASKWIAPRPDASAGNAPGAYTYRTTFDLTGFDPLTAVLRGRWVAAGTGAVRLNGSTLQVPSGGSAAWADFAISSGFAAGLNTLEFGVTTNAPQPTGVQVELTGTALPTTGPVITVTPPTAALGAGGSQQFTAAISGSVNTGVNWSIYPSGAGSISNAGLYTAPSSVSAPQTVKVIAQSQGDPTRTAAATVSLNPTSSALAIPVFSTGLAVNGILQDGATDPHYVLVSSPDAANPGPSAIVSTAASTWAPNTANSRWISPRASQSSGSAAGKYVYLTTFDLTGLNPDTAVISGQWAADDSAQMRLNGATAATLQPGGFATLTPFSITSGFVSGLNTLEFVVTNSAAGPTGLRVEIGGQAAPAGLATIPVFGTGVGSPGVLAQDGIVDSHYKLVTSADSTAPGPLAMVANSSSLASGWAPNGPDSKWISPVSNASAGNAPGTYVYRADFDLTGYNPATARLSGQWAADDAAIMKLNGIVVSGVSAPNARTLTPFNIGNGFLAGVNTLEFVVTNSGASGNPTGLRVDITGTVTR